MRACTWTSARRCSLPGTPAARPRARCSTRCRLLQQADEVKVVWVNPQAEGAAPVDVPAGDICAALARHGVKCEATEVAHPHTGVGRTLLARAAEYGSDLLVMGCYG